jgi:hypothetical protein
MTGKERLYHAMELVTKAFDELDKSKPDLKVAGEWRKEGMREMRAAKKQLAEEYRKARCMAKGGIQQISESGPKDPLKRILWDLEAQAEGAAERHREEKGGKA